MRIPHAVRWLVFGLLTGAVLRRFFPALKLGDEFFHPLVFRWLLPPLVFESAFHLDPQWLRRDRRSLFVLAVVAVVLSTLLVGFPLHAVFGVELQAALVFGALISATDPVSVVAVFKEVGAPARLANLVEGESLLNDATAIMLFQALQSGTPLSGLPRLLWVAGGALLVGVAGGWAARWLLARARPVFFAIAVTLFIAYGSFLLADRCLEVSGILATLTAGLLAARAVPAAFAPSLHRAWERVAMLANTLAFFAIGWVVDLFSLGRLLPACLVALGVVYLARALSVFASLPLARDRVPSSYQLVLFWGGLRGALAIALLFSLPPGFPNKDFFFTLGSGVVLATLFLNATTVAPLLRRLRLSPPRR